MKYMSDGTDSPAGWHRPIGQPGFRFSRPTARSELGINYQDGTCVTQDELKKFLPVITKVVTRHKLATNTRRPTKQGNLCYRSSPLQAIHTVPRLRRLLQMECSNWMAAEELEPL